MEPFDKAIAALCLPMFVIVMFAIRRMHDHPVKVAACLYFTRILANRYDLELQAMGLRALASSFVGLSTEALGAGAALEEAAKDGLNDGAEDDLSASVCCSLVAILAFISLGGECTY